MGYWRAGFEVFGVDEKAQPHYPFWFHQGDVLAVLDRLLAGGAVTFSMRDGATKTIRLRDLAAAHASPPCQEYSETTKLHGGKGRHPDIIEPVRARLIATGLPYTIENVVGAPIRADAMLCGSMFGLRIAKHRIFEASFQLHFELMPPCDHSDLYDPWHGPGRTAEKLRAAQDIDWLPIQGGASRKRGVTGDLFNAIPPAYTEFLGRHLLAHLSQQRPAA